MPEYTYDYNRQLSTLIIWKGNRKVLISADVTQRKQAKILFQRYVEERSILCQSYVELVHTQL